MRQSEHSRPQPTKGSGPSRGVRVVAVTSGKGGVGKTSVSINLAIATAALGRRVVLLDADLGLANVDLLLGLRAQRNLSHVLDGECGLEDIMLDGPEGIKVIPASSGIKRMSELGPTEHAGLVYAFSALAEQTDVLIVDTSAGIADSVVSFCGAAHETVVVVCNEPASITDAYALIKVLNQHARQTRFRILANMTRDPDEGLQIFDRLQTVTGRFLDVTLDLIGSVPYDASMRRAVQRQRAVSEIFPDSEASNAFKKLAVRTDNWPIRQSASGNLEFFVERMIQPGPAGRVAQV